MGSFGKNGCLKETCLPVFAVRAEEANRDVGTVSALSLAVRVFHSGSSVDRRVGQGVSDGVLSGVARTAFPGDTHARKCRAGIVRAMRFTPGRRNGHRRGGGAPGAVFVGRTHRSRVQRPPQPNRARSQQGGGELPYALFRAGHCLHVPLGKIEIDSGAPLNLRNSISNMIDAVTKRQIRLMASWLRVSMAAG